MEHFKRIVPIMKAKTKRKKPPIKQPVFDRKSFLDHNAGVIRSRVRVAKKALNRLSIALSEIDKITAIFDKEAK